VPRQRLRWINFTASDDNTATDDNAACDDNTIIADNTAIDDSTADQDNAADDDNSTQHKPERARARTVNDHTVLGLLQAFVRLAWQSTVQQACHGVQERRQDSS